MVLIELSFDCINNLVDMVEKLVVIYDWFFECIIDDELMFNVEGLWVDYYVLLNWRDDLEVLYLVCVFEMCVFEVCIVEVYCLIVFVNEQFWFGYFDIWL